jgi:hypothetical protein
MIVPPLLASVSVAGSVLIGVLALRRGDPQRPVLSGEEFEVAARDPSRESSRLTARRRGPEVSAAICRRDEFGTMRHHEPEATCHCGWPNVYGRRSRLRPSSGVSKS